MNDDYSHSVSGLDKSLSSNAGGGGNRRQGFRRKLRENLLVTIGMLFGFLLADDIYSALLRGRGNAQDRSYQYAIEQHEASMDKQWERLTVLKERKANIEERLWEVDQEWCLEHLAVSGDGGRRFWASVMAERLAQH
jgi:hypothetical protein